MFRSHRLGIALLVAFVPAGYAAERFGGSATLAPKQTQTSANLRFALTAELQAAPATAKVTTDARFSVIAELAAPKSALTSCGPVTDALFKNGFEN
jgi:hypothetical protein